MLLSTAILLCIGALNTLALPIAKIENDQSYILPEGKILPTNYKVTIDVSKSFEDTSKAPDKFTGVVVIIATIQSPIDEIVLHAANMTFPGQDGIIVLKNGRDLFKSYNNQNEEDLRRQFLRITTTETLQKNDIVTITIKYEAILHTDMHGFYVSKYDENKINKYVLTTQFQPTHARRAFPCFDEPKYKATFDLTFKKQEHYKVLSNTKLDSTHPNHGLGKTEVIFPTTPKMSTYLVAFIVSEFEVSPTNTIDYNVWSRPEAKNQTHWATKYMYPIVEDLNNFTNIEYSEIMEKMDMAALPDFSAGAMENWGLLTYRETALLVDDNLSTNKDIQRVVSVISHEVAHQWFGNLVTLTWWMNTWLNEGFARYFEYHTTGHVLPEWEMEKQFVVEQQQSVFGVDALAKSTPLTLPVYTPSQVSSHFGSISYSKGGSVIRMMENFLGSEHFKAGLQSYLKSHVKGNTEPADLWTSLQDTIDKSNVNLEYPIKSIMSTWISQAGYPVIKVKLNSGYVDFSQQRFYINPEENTEKAPKQTWYVPISYTTSKDMDFKTLAPKLWLTPNEPQKIISIGDSDFLIVNIQESGYYRVDYDDELWKKIANALPTDTGKKIDALNKAQIVDDVLNLARAGLVDYEIAFNVTDYLAGETGYYPWYSAFQAFKYLVQRYSDEDSTGIKLRSYLKDLMETLVKDKDFNEVQDEPQISVFNKVAALDWACNLGHDRCLSKAKALFKAFKEQGTEIPRNLRTTVYCTALRYGNKDDWDFLWDKFVASNSAAEKIGIINVLGCSKNTDILNDYLQRSIDPNPNSPIRSQDASYVFTSVYTGNTVGVDVAFKFIQSHHKEIIQHYNGMNDLEKAVLGLAGRLTDKKKIVDFKAVLKQSEDFDNFRDAAFETMDQNVAWAEKYNDIIGDVLNKKKSKTNTATGIISNKYMLLFIGFMSIYFYV